MLTKVDVLNPRGTTLSLPLQSSTPGYTVKSIDGLDPVKATLVSSSFAQLDGSQFQAAKRENRNIIIKIGIEPYFGVSTVEALRSALYAYFMPKTAVTLKFFIDGTETYDIEGRVESCEATIFAKDPEVSVSIICFDPSFKAPAPVLISDGLARYNGATRAINYAGTIETGYILELDVDRAISSFSIFNNPPGASVADQMDLAFGTPLSAGDVVKITTEMNDKKAILTHSASDSSILYAVSMDSKWGQLWPGTNNFRVQLPSAVGSNTIPFKLTYTPKYGGL